MLACPSHPLHHESLLLSLDQGPAERLITKQTDVMALIEEGKTTSWLCQSLGRVACTVLYPGSTFSLGSRQSLQKQQHQLPNGVLRA